MHPAFLGSGVQQHRGDLQLAALNQGAWESTSVLVRQHETALVLARAWSWRLWGINLEISSNRVLLAVVYRVFFNHSGSKNPKFDSLQLANKIGSLSEE